MVQLKLDNGAVRSYRITRKGSQCYADGHLMHGSVRSMRLVVAELANSWAGPASEVVGFRILEQWELARPPMIEPPWEQWLPASR